MISPGLVLTAALAASSFGVESDLEQGIAFYWSGEYRRTIDTLASLCDGSSRVDEKVECLKYLGFSHVAVGDSEGAHRAFKELLDSDPEHALDASLVSPKIVRHFETARGELVDDRFARAKKAYADESFDEASLGLDAVLALDPNHVLAREYRDLLAERRSLEEKRQAMARTEPETPEPAPEEVEEPDEDRVYHVTSAIRPPTLVTRVNPDYPIAARRMGRQGTVVVTAVVDATGAVVDARVVRGVGPELDRAAVDAVRKWTYRPATKDGRPVAVHSVVKLSFTLDR